MNRRTNMKTPLRTKLFLCVALLALGIPGRNTAQAQIGGVPLWTNRYDGIGQDSPRAIAVDGSGNVVVTGLGHGSYYYDDADFATIKYSGAGVPLWTNYYNGGYGSDIALAMSVDDSGDVFVTGASAGTNNYLPDYATIKYSGGGVPLWTNRYDGPGNGSDWASAI